MDFRPNSLQPALLSPHNEVSSGQQCSSPTSGCGGSGSGTGGPHSGLEALLAACELAAEQEGMPAKAADGTGAGAASTGTAGAAAAAPIPAHGGSGSGAGSDVEARGSVPQQPGSARPGLPPPRVSSGTGASIPSFPSMRLPPPSPTAGLQALSPVQPARDVMLGGLQHPQGEGGELPGPGLRYGALQLGGAMGPLALGAGLELALPSVSGAAAGMGMGAMGVGMGGGGGGGAANNASYLNSNAFKNRRHKSKVYIKPNKVVYLPTTFVEEEFDVARLPLDCELLVEAEGELAQETFEVTIKAVPRQGLSTMYCMTNVMRFQQQYLNWQIYNWTRIDDRHIKIHLHAPNGSHAVGAGSGPRAASAGDLDRAVSLTMPDVAHRSMAGPGAARRSEDGLMAAAREGAQSLKRKSDTGRYCMTKTEKRLVTDASMRDAGLHPAGLDLRVSSNGYRPSPIPESPPASPVRRASAGAPMLLTQQQRASLGLQPSAQLPPRLPSQPQLNLGTGPLPLQLQLGSQSFTQGSLSSRQAAGQVQQQLQALQQLQRHSYNGGMPLKQESGGLGGIGMMSNSEPGSTMSTVSSLVSLGLQQLQQQKLMQQSKQVQEQSQPQPQQLPASLSTGAGTSGPQQRVSINGLGGPQAGVGGGGMNGSGIVQPTGNRIAALQLLAAVQQHHQQQQAQLQARQQEQQQHDRPRQQQQDMGVSVPHFHSLSGYEKLHEDRAGEAEGERNGRFSSSGTGLRGAGGAGLGPHSGSTFGVGLGDRLAPVQLGRELGGDASDSRSGATAEGLATGRRSVNGGGVKGDALSSAVAAAAANDEARGGAGGIRAVSVAEMMSMLQSPSKRFKVAAGPPSGEHSERREQGTGGLSLQPPLQQQHQHQQQVPQGLSQLQPQSHRQQQPQQQQGPQHMELGGSGGGSGTGSGSGSGGGVNPQQPQPQPHSQGPAALNLGLNLANGGGGGGGGGPSAAANALASLGVQVLSSGEALTALQAAGLCAFPQDQGGFPVARHGQLMGRQGAELVRYM